MVKKLEDIRYFIVPELYDYLKDAESGGGADIRSLEEEIRFLKIIVGDTNRGLVKDIYDLKNIIGDSSGGLVADFNSVYTLVHLLDGIVGQTDSDPNTVLGQLKTIFTDIGNDNLTTTIKGRIKVLEDARTPTSENTEPTEP